MSIKDLPFLSYTTSEKGRFLLYIVAFVPLFYKLIVPFFVIAGLSNATIIINPTLIILGVLWSSSDFKKSVRSIDVLLYIFIALMILFSANKANEKFVDENWTKFTFTVLSYLFVGLIINYERDRKILYATAWLGLITQVFWIGCQLAGIVEVGIIYGDSKLGEQMEQAYMLLFPFMFFFIEYTNRHCIIDLLCIVLSVLLVFFMATRGPLVLMFVFVPSYLFFFKKFEKYNIIKKVILFGIGGIIVYFKEYILFAIIPIAVMLGFSTRAFDSILEAKMGVEDSSYRDDIYGFLYNALSTQEGALGHGWGGDRILMSGTYAHNFELEILIQFGWIFGSLILVLIAIRFLQAILKTRGTETAGFLYMMLFLGVMELQVSNTYVEHLLLFVFIGYCTSVLRESNTSLCSHK